MKKNYNDINKNVDTPKEFENESSSLETTNINENYHKSQFKIKIKKNIYLNYLYIIICIFSLLLFLFKLITKKKLDYNLIETNYSKIIKYQKQSKEKIGIVFVFNIIFGNGIGRMLSLLLNELVKIKKYDIYVISNPQYEKDFKFDKRVNRIPIFGDQKLITDFDRTHKIKYYVLQNDLDANNIKWYKHLNNGNKKVIGIMHGVYLSCVYTKVIGVYPIWKNNKLYDAFVHVIPDDYYIYKKFNFYNTFFIPNLYTFNPEKTPISNLTSNNLMIMGRENDLVKGGIYGIYAMNLIVKEIPDAKLYFISSDSRIEFIRDLIKKLNITENVEIIPYIENVSQYFLKSSVLLYPSLSESFPMVMNEGKAHGLPIVAFNVSYSPPYQKGVIIVDMLNYKKMAEEAIKLLNNYDYRKKMGMEAKLSLKDYSNRETIDKWDKLFSILDKDDLITYKSLQKYTYEKYYEENKAKERLESNYNFGRTFNKDFSCHTFDNMTNLSYINNIQKCTS